MSNTSSWNLAYNVKIIPLNQKKKKKKNVLMYSPNLIFIKIGSTSSKNTPDEEN